MRNLNKKQKKLLDQYAGKASDVYDLPMEVWEEIEELNDFETLYQVANGYLWNKYFIEVEK